MKISMYIIHLYNMSQVSVYGVVSQSLFLDSIGQVVNLYNGTCFYPLFPLTTHLHCFRTIVSKAEESFICRSHKDVTEMCQKGEVSVTMLILSSLLNLMSLRDGQSFKEQLRLLGTLDHVASLGK